MGKIKTEKRAARKGLSEELLNNSSEVKLKNRPGREKTHRKDDEDKFVDDKLSKKILEQARAQQDELEEEHGSSSKKTRKGYLSSEKSKGTKKKTSKHDDTDSEEDEEDEGDNFDAEQYYEHFEVDEGDEKAMASFMSEKPQDRRTLADIIMERINEKKTEIQSQVSEAPERPPLDEKIVSVFKSVGEVLSKYRSGKIPKPFKIIPSLANWEEVLYCTDPDTWTPAAMYQATRIFTSNLNAKMAQRFFNLVLLPRVRDDIAEYRRLNYHLYMSLKKSLFKPAAFFKGILIPLCESGTCTLREATIVASVLIKTSVPVLHSAATMLKIAEMQYNGANSIFLQALLEKKYALPFRVIDALVYHFLKFQSDQRDLPVLWYKSLLLFVQRYKEDIASEQKDALMELSRKHNHYKITPEIRRELTSSKSRDEEDPANAVGMNMDDD